MYVNKIHVIVMFMGLLELIQQGQTCQISTVKIFTLIGNRQS